MLHELCGVALHPPRYALHIHFSDRRPGWTVLFAWRKLLKVLRERYKFVIAQIVIVLGGGAFKGVSLHQKPKLWQEETAVH